MVTKSPSCGHTLPLKEDWRICHPDGTEWKMRDLGAKRVIMGNWEKESSHPRGILNAVRKRRQGGDVRVFMWILGNSFYYLFNNNALLVGEFRNPREGQQYSDMVTCISILILKSVAPSQLISTFLQSSNWAVQPAYHPSHAEPSFLSSHPWAARWSSPWAAEKHVPYPLALMLPHEGTCVRAPLFLPLMHSKSTASPGP